MLKTDRYVKFEDESIDRCIGGQKRITLRLGWEGKRWHTKVGDRFIICDESEDPLAVAEVDSVMRVEARHVHTLSFSGHYDYKGFEDFVEHMTEYYDRDRIFPGDEVTILVYHIVEEF